jgi:hypothetical protein
MNAAAALVPTGQSPTSANRLRNAKKEIGFGMPPSFFGDSAAKALNAILAAPTSRGVIVESASWTVVVPVTDAQVAATFGNVLNIFGTPNGQPPAGVASAQNTLLTPGIPSADMILLGIRPRFLVEPESRLIRGNVYDPTDLTTALGSPDVYSENDFTNNAFGVPGEGTPADVGYLAAEFLWGTPTWRIAYAAMKAYDLQWAMDYQENLIKEPMVEVASVQPFAEAQAAGTSFTSNIDRIAVQNARMATLGLATPLFFSPITHKRLGSFNAGGATNTGDFTVTREEDGSPTVFGGIGTPQDPNERSPLVFAVPVYWPAGQPLGITYQVRDQVALSEMQRWLSVTGGVGGVAGSDLNLPPGVLGGFTATGAGIMDEVTVDPVGGAGVPTAVSQGAQLNRCLEKGGTLVMQIGLIGMRITQPWKAAVMQAINAGIIQAPMGFGTLPSAT